MDYYGRDSYLTGVAGFWLPLAQALVSGLFVFWAALPVAQLLEAARPWLWALLSGAVMAAGFWFTAIASWRRLVYAELMTTGEAIQPQDPGTPASVRVEIASNDGRRLEFLDLNVDPERLAALAAGILEGRPFAESAWVGADNLFSRAEFSALRDELIKRDLLTWNSPRNRALGVSLTANGATAMRTFAAMAPHPEGELTHTRR
jgi:hypothetical protein